MNLFILKLVIHPFCTVFFSTWVSEDEQKPVLVSAQPLLKKIENWTEQNIKVFFCRSCVVGAVLQTVF